MENLVFASGGVKSLSFCGAIHALKEANMLNDIKRIAGSSAGAVAATLFACGFDGEDMAKMAMDKDTGAITSNSSLLNNLWRLLHQFGFYPGDIVYSWMEEFFKKKNLDPTITFIQLHEKLDKELIITGTDLNERKTIYFGPHTTPNMEIREAVRISTTIPLIFAPIDRSDSKIMVDGAVLCHYPMHIFETIDPTLEKTVGFMAMSESDREDKKEINDIFQMIDAILYSLIRQSDKYHVKEIHKQRTIYINTEEINATDFDLSYDDKKFLIRKGYRSARRFLKKKYNISCSSSIRTKTTVTTEKSSDSWYED